jgi:membrane protein DedA with SNARE-associated domain
MMTALVTDHAPVILFFWVLGNQAGVPLPVVPAILAAGALSRGFGDLAGVVAVVVGAALCADLAWYGVGRLGGVRALIWVRRFPWTSRAIDRMANLSPIRRAVALVSARFLPEANPVAAGLAGASRATLGRYLPYAMGTAVVWASTWSGMGYVLGAVTSRGDTMVFWTLVVLLVGGMSVVLAGVLAGAGRQTRREEGVATEAASSSRQAA